MAAKAGLNPPPTPSQLAILQRRAAMGDPTARGILAHMAIGMQQGGISPVNEGSTKQSNLRFRSFAERYMVTRSEFFRQDPDGLAADTWQCILDARRAYKLIGQVGLNVDD